MSKKILIGIVFIGVLAITLYNFRGTSFSTEGYQEKITKLREATDREFKE